MTLTTVLAQAQPAGGNQWSSIVMLLLLFVVFYFFMIRPQSKKQKEIRKFRESMRPGDKVITAGGIYGKIVKIDESKVSLEIAKGVTISVDKGSVFANAADTASGASVPADEKKEDKKPEESAPKAE